MPNRGKAAHRPDRRQTGSFLTKLLSVFVVLAMIIQIIKPIGLPGLRKRADFWKLPLAGFVVIVLISTLQL
jgi:hypothetical protein